MIAENQNKRNITVCVNKSLAVIMVNACGFSVGIIFHDTPQRIKKYMLKLFKFVIGYSMFDTSSQHRFN